MIMQLEVSFLILPQIQALNFGSEEHQKSPTWLSSGHNLSSKAKDTEFILSQSRSEIEKQCKSSMAF